MFLFLIKTINFKNNNRYYFVKIFLQNTIFIKLLYNAHEYELKLLYNAQEHHLKFLRKLEIGPMNLLKLDTFFITCLTTYFIIF